MTIKQIDAFEIDPFALPVHPAAEAFAMLDEEDLAELAESIKADGLQFPLVVQKYNGEVVLIDGRNRRVACQRAGVKPTIKWLPPSEDPVSYIYATNITRRHMTKGQRAMATAKLFPVAEQGKRTDLGSTSLKINEVAESYVRMARAVLHHAPALVDSVLSGAKPLAEAYSEAQNRKKEGESTEARFAKVQAADPDLARSVAEEEITLVMAEAELKERATAALREHDENFELHAKVTNRLWCYCNDKSLASLETSLIQQRQRLEQDHRIDLLKSLEKIETFLDNAPLIRAFIGRIKHAVN